MANRQLLLPSGFPRAPLGNGVGRFMCQLKRVTLKFCKERGDSRGMRDFLEHDLVDFATKHPSVVVYVKPRRHRSSVIKGEYCNGKDFWISAHKMNREEIQKWLHLATTQNDGEEFRLRKMMHTDNPSIQGPWTPFTHRDPKLNNSSFPLEELSEPVFVPKSATQQLIEIFNEQQRTARHLEEKQGE
ncbi:hypothetical protein FOCC_FOCC011809 [Frankliniella occidentalis]|uniref:Large ribosomal subunit protein mL43 n=1 Tax=Frankliniella occidentalis TaxID=133901 RepID=A0A6J1TKU5_FRAOC|nr:39S ribosomal protein L43, mitochondrial [Frankliniella occidentalis]KAE8742680.1 hypothetical protein FOCC_FOCC011809 [Frankliniella occidentalis]